MVAAVPQIEGLTVEDMLDYCKAKHAILRHLPDERDWVHIDRKWLCDIVYTLDRDGFQEFIKRALNVRKEKVLESRSMLVEVRPEFAKAFAQCMSFSCKNTASIILDGEKGRFAGLLKGQSKRKRTRAELNEVRSEEEELKQDK
jgi:hypothetical protein